MTKNYIGNALMLSITVFLVFVMPMSYIGIIETAKAQEHILNTTQEFVDMVTDTKRITQNDLDKLSLDLSATTIPIDFTIMREMKVINPVPGELGQTYTTYVPVDDITTFNTGDFLTIEVYQVGKSFSQSFAASLTKTYVPSVEVRLSKKVR